MPLKLTVSGALPLVGLAEAVAVGDPGGPVLTTVVVACAVAVNPLLSVTLKTALKVPTAV